MTLEIVLGIAIPCLVTKRRKLVRIENPFSNRAADHSGHKNGTKSFKERCQIACMSQRQCFRANRCSERVGAIVCADSK